MTRKSTRKVARKADNFDQSQPLAGGPPIVASTLVEVRNSPVHGRGVFAVAPIAKGTRILEYLGDRVSHDAADARYDDHDESDNHTFLFIVDKQTVIDAGVGGNDARFINHSCRPNCYVHIVDGTIWIRAARPIRKGEELTYNYNTDGEGLIKCRCRPGCQALL